MNGLVTSITVPTKCPVNSQHYINLPAEKLHPVFLASGFPFRLLCGLNKRNVMVITNSTYYLINVYHVYMLTEPSLI